MRFNSNRKPNHDTHATTFIDGQHVGDAINESRRHNHAPVNHWHFENLESVYHDWLISVKVPQASRLASDPSCSNGQACHPRPQTRLPSRF